MILYLDSSFCVAMYAQEPMSPIVDRTVKSWTGSLCISGYGEVEVSNAFQLQLFRGQINASQAASMQQSFESDLRAGTLNVEPLTSVVLAHAKRIALAHTAAVGTRTLDIIHVAAALAMGADQFASFDAKQRALAKLAGLKVTPRSLP